MKNLFSMHIHPNVWHWLGLSLEVVKDHFCFLFGFIIYFIHCHAPLFRNLSFYYKLAEVPGVARGI